MMEYIIEHRQHKSMLFWSNEARFATVVACGLFEKRVGNKGLMIETCPLVQC